jgi:hypothetical protein
MDLHDRRYLLAGAGLLGVAAMARTAQAGSLNPPGAPAPTGKTTQQLYDAIVALDLRIPVQSLPGGGGAQYVISQPGSYYLAGGLDVTGGIDGISITASNVTLDLNGFAVVSKFGGSPSGIAIKLGAVENVTIRNGSIQGAVTVSGGGLFSGGGFNNGIYSTQTLGTIAVEGVNVSRVGANGIQLGQSASSASLVVRGCTVRVCAGIGIQADTVQDCTALSCGDTGIIAQTAENCRGEGIVSHGVSATVANNCVGNSTSGDGIHATNANNCVGTTASNTGAGVSASAVATGCSGTATGGGQGVYAVNAVGCLGSSASGYGIYCIGTATNCQGSSSSSIGVNANRNAENCEGSTSSGLYGLNVGNNASNCSGSTSGGAGTIAVNVGRTASNCFGSHGNTFVAVKAQILIGCTGFTSGATTFQFTNKYNMP